MPTVDHAVTSQRGGSATQRAKSPPLAASESVRRKTNGIHYTPTLLAAYLARQIVANLPDDPPANGSVSVLDPACGEGELLKAIADAARPGLRARLALTGFDKDAVALRQAEGILAGAGVASINLECVDFLSTIAPASLGRQMGFQFTTEKCDHPRIGVQFDAIISNPPYVRTQVLGSAAARDLARRFDLAGRVDLYHAFVKGITLALREGGILGLLTSNRFLSVQSGFSMREWLTAHFQLVRLVDLGDTKLFEAAVLPAVLVALKKTGVAEQHCEFIRVYQTASQGSLPAREVESVLEVLDGSFSGYAFACGSCFQVETGRLNAAADSVTPWTMSNDSTDSWLSTVNAHSSGVFSDVSKVCVGIKTTADAVFVRDDWDALPDAVRPEEELLHPLVTHHLAARWHLPVTRTDARQVLYPYDMNNRNRTPVDLADYPCTRRYLLQHRERLQSRSYVIESGRQWYEIWVPHRPADWSRPKIAFPDISETGKFFLVEEGWIVNGDCYWAKLLPGKDLFWLHLMLAVANSSFIHKFYDLAFHNKLYAGRRRFMSQYVNRFPLPKLDRAKGILDMMPELLHASSTLDTARVERFQVQVDELVWQAFGLSKEVAR
ncbi:MAG: Eco57I restriction-modification methylase domain-containing protein [Verrucomicrobiota bacterium]|jgi:methylase of polypeptide subunit release factors